MSDPQRIMHLDYETKSECNLLTQGAYQYAKHPSTRPLLFRYWFEDEPEHFNNPKGWRYGEPLPRDFCDHLARGERRSIYAHNAQFERLITWYVICPDYDVPEPPLETFYCTAAQAAARAHPRNLDDLGRCLGLKIKKQRRGRELIKLMCVPPFEWTIELEDEMYSYCGDDLIVETNASLCTAPLNDEEFEDFLINERINDRGIKCDIQFAAAARTYAKEEAEDLATEIEAITGGKVTGPRQFQKLKLWMEPYAEADDRIRKAMTHVKSDRRTGKETRKISLDKNARYALGGLDGLPEEVYELIDVLNDAGNTSVSKYSAMLLMADRDTDRVHGTYMYAGASQTQRFSSVKLQLHNMSRDCAKKPEHVRQLVIGNCELDGPLKVLSSMLRPSLIAGKGKTFVVGDSAQIEARVLPWLAGPDADWVLDIFREVDRNPDLPDVYMRAAAGIYGVPVEDVTEEQRQIGKVAVLSLGYQGGWRAFLAMAKNYGVFISRQAAEAIKVAWRETNPWAVDFWKAIEFAAIQAAMHPGKEYSAGRVTYFCPAHGEPLYCMLPFGVTLSYPRPKLMEVMTPWGNKLELTAIKAAWKPKQGESEWPRVGLYGGLLAENATQATAGAILRHYLRECDKLNLPVVLHTHDEVGLESPNRFVEDDIETLTTMMKAPLPGAPDLPMNCGVWSGPRYRK